MHRATDSLSKLLFLESGIDSSHPPYFQKDESQDKTCHSSLTDLFCEVATRQADKPAISTSATTWTYRTLFEAVQRFSDQLKNTGGYKPGDRIILLVPNSIEYIAAFYGILMSRGIVVPLPAKTESGTLQKILKSTEARLIVSTQQIVNRQPDLQSLQSEKFHGNGESKEINQTTVQNSDTSIANDLATIFFTAGSSGTPKGVMLSHSNLISNAQSIQEYLELKETERPLCVIPFHHAFGNSVLQSHILMGSHLILDGNALFPESIVKALVQHNCTSLSAVPDLFRTLLERTSFKQTTVPTLNYMSVAGGALPHQLSVEISQCISPARFFVMYGQTEATARLAYVPPENLAEVCDGCIGRAIPGVTLEVVDDNGNLVDPECVGELRAKGPNVMLGYWQDSTETQERIRNGWLHTGDLAMFDRSGWITIKGRRNSLVKISGYRVHPVELEEFALRSFPVSQAVAVPFEAKNIGTRLAMYVKLTQDGRHLSVSEMMAICRKKLPRQMVPDHIQIVEAFPLNHAMKIDRSQLSLSAE